MTFSAFRWKRFCFQFAGFLLAAVVIWFLCRSFSTSWEQIRSDAAHISWPLFLLASMVYAAAFVLNGWNWMILQRRAAPQISRFHYLDIFITSAFARYLPGGIWNIVGKAVWCIRAGASPEATSGGIVGEYLFQIISSGLFLFFFLPKLFAFNWMFGLILLIGGVAVISTLPFWTRLGFRILAKFFHSKAEFNLSSGFLYRLLGGYLFAWLVTGGGLLILAASLSGEHGAFAPNLVFGYPVAWVAGFLSPSPNGLGVRELVLKWLADGQMPAASLALLLLTARCWTILGELIALAGIKICVFARRRRAERS